MVFVGFLIAVRNYLTRAARGEALFGSRFLRALSITQGKNSGGLRKLLRAASQEARRGGCGAQLTFSSYSVWDPSPWNDAAHIPVGCLRHAQKCAPWMFLEPVQVMKVTITVINLPWESS